MKLKEEWEIVMMIETHVLLSCSFVFNVIDASLQHWNKDEHLNKCIPWLYLAADTGLSSMADFFFLPYSI